MNGKLYVHWCQLEKAIIDRLVCIESEVDIVSMVKATKE
jgi:hypothetical protein